MIIDGHSFNQEWSWSKTKDEFVKEFKGMDHIFPETDNREAKLSEAFDLLQKGKPADYKVKKPSVIAPPDLVKQNAPIVNLGNKPAE